MNTLHNPAIEHHYNLLQASGGQEHAFAILHEFLHLYEDDSPREYLWCMLVHCLTRDKPEPDAIDRSDLLCFYEYCVFLFKAIEALANSQKKGALICTPVSL